jgi:transposase
MNLLDLQQYTISEEKSKEYLQVQGILQRFDHCPYCRNTRIGRIRRQMLQLSERVGAVARKYSRRIESSPGPCINCIQTFELDTSVREAAHQLGLSYYTVYDLFDLFRQSIVRTDYNTSFTLSGEIEMDESYFGVRRKGNRGMERPERSPCSVSWNGEEKSGSKLSRM